MWHMYTMEYYSQKEQNTPFAENTDDLESQLSEAVRKTNIKAYMGIVQMNLIKQNQ